MTQIENIGLTRMSNGAHFRFMKNILERVKNETSVTAKAAKVINELEVAFKKEDELLKISQKSMLTDEIAAADQERDALYMTCKKTVEAMLGMPVKEVADAAKIVNQKLVDFNIDVKAQLDKETGMLDNLITDLTGPLKAEVQKLSLTPCIERLKEVNDALDKAMSQRDEDKKYVVAGALKAARLASDEAYRNLTTVVNAFVILEGDEQYRDYVAYVNAMIVRVKREVLGQSVDDSGTEGPGGEDTGGEETPDTGGTTPEPTPDPNPTPGGGDDGDDFV